MLNQEEHRILALAAVFQAAHLVDQVARHGHVDMAEATPLLESIFITNPGSIDDIYPGAPAPLERGLRTLHNQLQGGEERNLEVARYAVGLLHLQKRLQKRGDLMERLSSGIERVREQRVHFDLNHPTIFAALANLYSETISTLTPRIMVRGDNNHLAQAGNADKVRALLLAGMRAAVLWSQYGGSRWKLLLGRKRLLANCTRLINTIEP